MKVVIIDYDAGNIRSILNMLDFCGIKAEISSNADVILSADKLIFPGQGHFEQAIINLTEKNLVPVIKEAIEKNIPFLGICLGLQILFERSEEAPEIKGLGILKGEVKKFKNVKVPQIGWNKINLTQNAKFLKEDYFYFVNSYYVEPKTQEIIASTAFYEKEFCASVQHKNITAVQFHPEKSSTAGIEFFKNWLKA